MITYTVYKTYRDGKVYVEGRGTSSDTKPTENIANGSIIMEMDTSTMFMFDETGNTWRSW